MKKLFVWGLMLMAFVASCSDGKKKEFAEQVAGYVKGNEVDELKEVYPEAEFDSIGFAKDFEEIEIEPVKGTDRVRANFGKVAYMEFVEEKDGTMTIVESAGLAAFPQEKLDIAKKTGMVKKGMTDIEMDELMKDSSFFAWIARKSSPDNIISITPGKCIVTPRKYAEGMNSTWSLTLTNNSNVDIQGSDYTIGYTASIPQSSDGTVPNAIVPYSHDGMDLKKGESKTITITRIADRLSNAKIKWNISPVQLTKFAGYSGNEYAEYKKEKANNPKKASGIPSSGSLGQFDYLSTTRLTEADIQGYDSAELRLLRNAIFASHGYIFQSDDLINYFSNFSDYSPVTRNVTDFNAVESVNVAFIKAHE